MSGLSIISMWVCEYCPNKHWPNENYRRLGKWFVSDSAHIDYFRFYHWDPLDNREFDNGKCSCSYHHMHIRPILLTSIQDLECKSISKL